MFKQIFVIALLATVINAELVGWRNCGSYLAIIHQIRVSECYQTPCEMVRGTTYQIEVDATALANSNSLPFAMTATVLGIPITLLQGNACNDLAIGQCPALIGNSFTFRILYTVPTTLPMVSTVITSTLWNDFGDIGICVEVDAHIR